MAWIKAVSLWEKTYSSMKAIRHRILKAIVRKIQAAMNYCKNTCADEGHKVLRLTSYKLTTWPSFIHTLLSCFLSKAPVLIPGVSKNTLLPKPLACLSCVQRAWHNSLWYYWDQSVTPKLTFFNVQGFCCEGVYFIALNKLLTHSNQWVSKKLKLSQKQPKKWKNIQMGLKLWCPSNNTDGEYMSAHAVSG